MDTTKSIFLSDDNYYSNEADWQYMSVSQFKDFLKCPAAALAKLKGDWEPDRDNKPLLVGNFVHSYFETPEVHEKFIEENKEYMYSSRKPHGLLKEFQIAEQMIARLEQEPAFMNLYQGEKEVIVTGELYGVEWKGKIDCLNVENGYFVDLKTTKDIHEKKWDDYWGPQSTFIERYGYCLQMGVYQQLLAKRYGKPFVPLIVAVSKQTPSEAQIITLDEYKIEMELDRLESEIDRIFKIKMGQIEPEPCGTCEYCRGHQRIDSFVSMNEL
jgi:CRISPR/Cas system-associated exonuclease Cas4 (RecB family)